MPYIKQKDRDLLDPTIDRLLEDLANFIKEEKKEVTVGDLMGPLNYVLTRVLMGAYKFVVSPKYPTLALFSGVLSHMSTEFYQRVVVPYEEQKIAKNGDLPEFMP